MTGNELEMSQIVVKVTFTLLILCKSSAFAGSYLSNVPQCTLVITSDQGKNGTFQSPHYPQPYPPKTHCRYDFVGTGRERVQIVFTDFNLYHPDKNSTECGGADVLSVFVYSDGGLARLDDFCGISIPLAVMSNGNKMTLELDAPHSSRYNWGFTALYFFVMDYGIRTGVQVPDGSCIFVFNSNETSNGTFTSPNYPGFYPRDTECNYFFYGYENQHVELYFTYFHIDGVEPCDEHTHSDYVEFSNYRNEDRKYDRKCGTLKELKIKSDRKFFRVTFRSNDRYDATGFQATYQFTTKNNQLTIRNTKSSGAGRIRHLNIAILLLSYFLDLGGGIFFN